MKARPDPILFYVPEASPSLNKYAYSHWRKQHADKERWAKFLLAEVMRQAAPKATGPRKLTIERHGKRRLDVDNIIGGAKSCITDNLRKLGMLVEDHDRAVVFEARNAPLGKDQKPHTIILLEDLS